MTTKQVSELLGSKNVSHRNGKFKYWSSYYYRHGKSESTLIQNVKQKIPNAVIVDSGDHFHSFVGGAKSGSPKDSYFYVYFTLGEQVNQNGEIVA